MFKWPLINDNITEQDKRILADFILNTNRFTNGPKVVEFEKQWSEWLGTKYSVMVGSGAKYWNSSLSALSHPSMVCDI